MHVSKDKIFLVGCLGFIGGIGVASAVSLPAMVVFTTGAVGGIGCIVGVWSRRVLAAAVVLLAAGLGMVRYAATSPVVSPQYIHYYNGQDVLFSGYVAAEPDVRTDHVKLTIRTQSLDERLPVAGYVLVNIRPYPAYAYGDILRIRCQLQSPGVITGDDGRTFHYDRYLARYEIYSVCYRPDVTLVGTDGGSWIVAAILHTKSYFTERITSVIAEPEASFAGGLLLGARASMPEWLLDAFAATGTTHIIALSGYNITIIAVCIQHVCSSLWIGRRYAFWISAGAILFFVVMTGAPASVTRAGIMGGLVLVARQLGRMSRITNALVLAAAIMLLVNPHILASDAGFQLSFLATVGLVYLSPVVERVVRFLPAVFELRASAASTLSAIIMTTPLILISFGRVSAIAPLVNVVILPLIPFAMALGFLAGIGAILLPFIGSLVGWLAWGLLHVILSVIEVSSQLPFVSWHLPPVHWGWAGGLYALIGLFLWRYNKKPPLARPTAAVH